MNGPPSSPMDGDADWHAALVAGFGAGRSRTGTWPLSAREDSAREEGHAAAARFDFAALVGGPAVAASPPDLKRVAGPVAYAQPAERAKKLKTAHRHVRSPRLLLGPLPPSSPASELPASCVRLFASSTAGKPTRMAPAESRWTGDSAAWLAAEAALSRLALGDADDVALDAGASVGRARSHSAPPAMMLDFAAPTAAEPDAAPELLRAQLLQLLRTRTPEGGGGGAASAAGSKGGPALKLRRWVHYNSYTRRSLPSSPSAPSLATSARDATPLEPVAPAPQPIAAAVLVEAETEPAKAPAPRIRIRFTLAAKDDAHEAAAARQRRQPERPAMQRAKSAPAVPHVRAVQGRGRRAAVASAAVPVGASSPPASTTVEVGA